ncbi:G-TYPE LECTIN S-RECEPTOR-LIKE SERINE/THREONINE-PROTEIN KINASE SD2-5 [Salix viminalis]|uniref:G-TYPE LECTIN S-RECEPTOR-LIKE SERINE/THREONINE-PROTEIN KINASE SD2-5 n=1 Tax=Salix viminalis TaxID=40686 RepID=A0A9Q0NLN3_SALVM|nr:G-TYPE LECTIN S-RECEPTOR-LIKE SERINE/THREONINE-PROTEIN KINASE SD2-5 [Salix viminalis]
MAIQNDLFQARDSDDSGYHSVYHLKVQNSTHAVLQGMKRRELRKIVQKNLLGKPTRFYYEDLKAITGNFSEVLGEGGFGKVFEGILLDGIKMAVTQLDGSSPVRKSFLTWVEANGSIHHVNLPEEQMHLLNHFEKKEKENRLLDLVDNQIQDMRFNRAEMLTIMRVAA